MTAFFGYSVPGSTRKISWKILLGIAISITALAIVLYRINWRVLADSIGRASICFLFLGVLFFLCDLTMRSWRWQILLRPLGRYGLFKDSFPFYMIGYMANMTLLLRAGEIIRPYMFGKEYNVSKSGVFATVVVERLADMVFIAAMLLIIAGVMDIPLRVKQSAAIAGGIGILSFIVLWVLALDRRSGNRVNELLKRLPKGIYKRLERIIAAATSSLNNVFGLLMLSLSSVAVWTCGFFTIRSYLLAFGLQ
ncbi:MAG: flippase-like domain-containing protein, partial [Candidatus Omnitrophica bacterium]|nr:flippase-like domain-containing protein [Candidatus Omnitrophota bacterium]